MVGIRSKKYDQPAKAIMVSEEKMTEKITDLNVLLIEAEATKKVTKNQYIDLSNMDYRHDSETGLHVIRDRSTNEDFVLQTDTALKQLCRMIKVPHAFVVKNPNYLNDGIMSFWLDRAISGDESGSKKSKLTGNKVIRYFEKNGIKHVRAVADEDVVPVDNLDLIQTVLGSFGEDSLNLDFASGTGLDDESFHARFVTNHSFDPGDGLECSLGFHIRSSELVQGNLTLDSLIFRKICSNGAIVTYGNSSYFTSKFKDVMAEDLNSILTNCVGRMREDLVEMLSRIRLTMDYSMNGDSVRELFNSLKHRRGLNKTFVESIEGQALDPNIANFWQVTNTITRSAQILPDNNRIKYEKLAGSLLNLDLPKLG